jgi:hypothetical protein
MVMDRYAEAFQRAGFAAFPYDHRNFGRSGGEPRYEINPWVQSRGIRDAVSCVADLGEVDPARIAVWGDSGGGGEALVASAFDPRVKAVIAQCPVCGSAPPPPDPDGALANAMREVLDRGSVSGPVESTIGPLPVVSWDQQRHPSLLKPLSAFRWFMEYGGRHGSGWANDVTRVLPPTRVPFHPVLAAPRVLAPTLLLVAPEDEMVHANPAVSRLAFDRLGGPRAWHDIAGGHFGLLWYPSELFEEAVGIQTAFLQAHL